MARPVRCRIHDLERKPYQEITLTDFTEMKEVINRCGRSSIVYLFDEAKASNVTVKIVGVHAGIMGTTDIEGYEYLGVVSLDDVLETWVYYYQVIVTGKSSRVEFSSVFK